MSLIRGQTPSLPLIASSSSSISGAALASTALTFTTGISLATYLGIIAVVKYKSGTLGISVVKLKNTSGDNSILAALSTLTAANEISIPLSGSWNNTGNISVEVTTAGLAASTFDVFVYGIPKP